MVVGVVIIANGVPPAEDGSVTRLGERSHEIRDHHLLLRTYLPVALTEHPRFNIATWYRRVERGMGDDLSIDEIDFIRRSENNVICDQSDQSALREKTPRPGDCDALTSLRTCTARRAPSSLKRTISRSSASASSNVR